MIEKVLPNRYADCKSLTLWPPSEA